jgi:superfamily I DNA and/or RNA helicase
LFYFRDRRATSRHRDQHAARPLPDPENRTSIPGTPETLGQWAAPQYAVGPLWRARHAVIVGDPLQLEPIVTLPGTVQQALRRYYGVAEEWLPGATSVQRVADRLAMHGTYLYMDCREGRQRVWVGSPLRVHRRCDDPMFRLSNTIAYDGLMVFGTPPTDPETDPYRELPPSSWIDVSSPEAVGNWIPEEGRRLVALIKDLIHERGVDPAKIRVISPFREVVAGCEQVCVGLLPRKSVGTVHTMQGKEADIVFLMLGSGPQRPGARDWAAAKPNLLNVAVSRAKRRLYVIGNRKLWSGQRYFNALAQLPDPRSARPRAQTVQSEPGRMTRRRPR